MELKEMLIQLWHRLQLSSDAIAACSREYDLLCPHCREAGLGEVHLKLLPDNSGFLCAAMGHRYRANPNEPRPFGARSTILSTDAG